MTDLLHFDEYLFHLVNTGCHNLFFDWLMPLLRNKYVWVPLYVFIASFLLINYKLKGLSVVIALIMVVSLTDTMSSQVIKKSVQRLRPCKVLEPEKDMHLLVPCGSGFSFPSSHAANHFGVAVYLMLALGRLFKWLKLPLILWATAIAFAQVYVGVHYPLDVFAGAMLGTMIGWGVHLIQSNLLQGFSLEPVK